MVQWSFLVANNNLLLHEFFLKISAKKSWTNINTINNCSWMPHKSNITNKKIKIKKEITNWITKSTINDIFNWHNFVNDYENDDIFNEHNLGMTLNMMTFSINITCELLLTWWHFQSTDFVNNYGNLTVHSRIDWFPRHPWILWKICGM